jgi:ribonuclease H / adenosylcobalamin/alpha-ribazole phosphatase
MRLICVRHGESHSNASTDRVALPEAEGDRLTERGVAQARAAAEALAHSRASRLISSPMRRATETAAAIAERTGLEVEVNPLIHELREFEGYTELDAERQRTMRWSARMSAHPDDPHHAPDGADSFAAMVARVRRFKAQLEPLKGSDPQGDSDPTVIAVSHGIFLRFLFFDTVFGDAFVPAHAERLWRLRTANGALSVFSYGERGPAIDPLPAGWSCLSWMAPPARPPGRSSAGRPASAATAR